MIKKLWEKYMEGARNNEFPLFNRNHSNYKQLNNIKVYCNSCKYYRKFWGNEYLFGSGYQPGILNICLFNIKIQKNRFGEKYINKQDIHYCKDKNKNLECKNFKLKWYKFWN